MRRINQGLAQPSMLWARQGRGSDHLQTLAETTTPHGRLLLMILGALLSLKGTSHSSEDWRDGKGAKVR